MRKIFYLFLVVGLLSAACEESNPTVEQPQPPKGLVFSANTELSQSFQHHGGTATIYFSTDLNWVANSNQDWIDIKPDKGTPNNRNFIIYVSENNDTSARQGAVTVTTADGKSQSIMIAQDGQVAKFDIKEGDKYSVSYKEGMFTIHIETNITYNVEIPTDAASWLSVSSGQATQSSTATFTHKANDSKYSRSALVKFTDGQGNKLASLEITQSGTPEVFELDVASDIYVPSTGGYVDIKLIHNIDYTYKLPENASSWLTINEVSTIGTDADRNAAIDKLSLTVAENSTFEERNATIEFTATLTSGVKVITFTISQACQTLVFRINTTTGYDMSVAGGVIDMIIETNTEYTVSIPEDAQAWLNLKNKQEDSGRDILTFAVTPNDTFDERSTIVSFLDSSEKTLATIQVTQQTYDIDGENPIEDEMDSWN